MSENDQYGSPSRRDRGTKLGLIAGFLGLASFLWVARITPARGYELSLYAATPVAAWAGAGVAFVAAVLVAAYGTRGRTRVGASVLAVGTTAGIALLPFIRSYHSYGLADSLTHLGWTRGIATGGMSVLEIVYPGAHVTTATIHALTGIALGRALTLVIGLFTAIFLVFVPVTVRAITDDQAAVSIAAFSACFLLPITNVSTFLDFHTYSLTTFFFPVVLFLLLKYLAAEPRLTGWRNATSATGLLLIVSGIALDLLHPQVAVNVLAFFAAIVALQRLAPYLPGESRFARSRSVLFPLVGISAFFGLWTLRYEVVYSMFGRLVGAAIGFVVGDAPAAKVVANRQESATGVGTSLVELFGKLFAVHAAYGLLAAGLVLALLAGVLSSAREDRNTAIAYVGYGGIALVPYFLLYFVGDVSKYFFRHVGFAMVFVTFLGALALHALYRYATSMSDGTGVNVGDWLRPVAVVTVCIALVLSVAVMFPSPYIYKRNGHVSDQSMSGYRMAFDQGGEDVAYTSVGAVPYRYGDALRTDVQTIDQLPPRYMAAGNLTTYTNGTSYYFVVTEQAYQQQIYAKDQLRYDRSMFATVGTSFGVNRVQTNEGFTKYYVDSGVRTPTAVNTTARR
ncbi:hypothetical protein [Halomarina litorea]|uniref:hypothetical protein n=1 Tax=Halomarina litorea TaxID=2961595 RepID=UPI0020C456F0|nr:hypothetical protein [Halomarina sp. BCD28]